MKKITSGVLFLFISVTLLAQSNPVEKSDIVGRWIETERILEQKVDEVLTPSILIFKEDGNFHKGEDKEGVILFAIAGKFNVASDSINVNYFDFTGKTGNTNKLRKMSFKVLEMKDKTMKASIEESRYKRYTSTFRKQ